MVANRDSITAIAKPLIALIQGGEGDSSKALELAVRLERLVERSGTYERKYETNEERVLHRHLNLYRNKLEAAKTDERRSHWKGKIKDQRRKIAAFEASHNETTGTLDLDGL